MRTYGIIALSLLLALAGLPSLADDLTIGARRSLQVASGPFEVAGEPDSYAIAWLDRAKPLTTLWVAAYEDGRPAFTRLVAGGVEAEAGFFLERMPEGWIVAWRAAGTWRLNVVSNGESESSPLDRGNRLLALAPREDNSGRLLLLLETENETNLVSLDPTRGESALIHTFPVEMAGATLLSHDDGTSVVYQESDTNDLYYSRIGIDGGELRLLKLNSAPVKSLSRRLGAAEDEVLAVWIEEGVDQDSALLGRIGLVEGDTVIEAMPVSSVGKRVARISLSQQGDRLVVWDESNETRLVRLLAMDRSWDPVCEFEYEARELPVNTWILGDGDAALLFETELQEDGRQGLSVRELECHSEASEEQPNSDFERDLYPTGAMALEECLQDEQENSTRGAYDEPCDGLDNDSDGTVDNGCDLTCEDPQPAGPEVLISDPSYHSSSARLIWTGTHFAYTWTDNQSGNYEGYFTLLDQSGNRIGTDKRITNAPGYSGVPRGVQNGTGYGVVWVDDRNGSPYTDVYFARLDAAGDKIGSDVRISTVTTFMSGLSIAWTGTEYGICWGDGRHGDTELYFARVDSSGSMIGAELRLTNNPYPSGNVKLVWTGSQYGLVWVDYRNDDQSEIYFARLNATGAKIGADKRITFNPNSTIEPHLVWTGIEFMLAWADYSPLEIYTARLDSSGNQIGSNTQVTSSSFTSRYPSMAWNGSEIGLTWTDGRNFPAEIYFARLDSTGSKIGPDVRVSYADAASQSSRLSWTGSGYTVAWTDFRNSYIDVYFRRISCCDDDDSDGYDACTGDCNDADPEVNQDAIEFLDGLDNDCDGYSDEGSDRTCDEPESWGADNRISQDPATSGDPSVVWTGSEYGVVWPDGRDGNQEIYFSLVDSLGNRVGSELRISDDDTFDSDRPSIAWNGLEYGVAWHDDRDGNSEIYFARLDDTGARIGSGIRVTADSALSEYPCIVWAGSDWAIAWEDRRDGNREIYFARMDASGNKLGPDVRITSYANESYRPSLLWTGTEFGVAWHDYRDGNYEIYFATLDEVGGRTIDDLRITNDPANSFNPSVGYSDYEFAIAYGDNREGNYEIYLAWLETPGTFTVSERRITDDAASSTAPSLIWTGDEFGLVWQEQRDGNYEIYAARAAYSGLQVGSDVRLTYNSSSSYKPAIAWNGQEYGTAWYDGRNGGSEIYFTHMRCCDDDDDDGYNVCEGDSNDGDPTVNPGAPEICDGADNDGDSTVDEGCDGDCDSPQGSGVELQVNEPSTFLNAPDTVSRGDGFAAVWTDGRNAGPTEIYFARIDSSGSKIGSDLRVSYTGGSGPALAWTGSEYGVAWKYYGIHFARLDSDGNPIGSGQEVAPSETLPGGLSLAWTGSEYGLAWHAGGGAERQIYFVRIDATGNRIGSVIQVTMDPADSAWPALTWTGSEYGLAWSDARDPSYDSVYFARLDATGNKIGSDIQIVSVPSSVDAVDLLWNGSEYGVSWYQGNSGSFEIYFARLDATGAKIGSDLRVTDYAGNSGWPALAWTGEQYGISWQDDRAGNYEIYFTIVDAGGSKIGSDLRLTQDPGNSVVALLAWNGESYGVGWLDDRDGDYELLFTLLNCCDDMDSDGWDECSGDTNDADPDVNPDAVERCDGIDNDGDGDVNEGCDSSCDEPERDGGEYRVTDSGYGAAHPEIIWNGSEYVLSFTENVTSFLQDNNIFLARFDSAGNQIGSNVRVTYEDSESYYPSLVWTGNEYGLAWTAIEADWEIYFARVDSLGNIIGSSIAVTNNGVEDALPQLFWTGSEYGIIWIGDVAGTRQLFFARLDALGNPIGTAIQLTTDADVSMFALRAIWTGEHYALNWLDNRGAEPEIYFARLDDRGNMIGTESIIPSGSPSSKASLAWNGSGYGLVWNEMTGSNTDLFYIGLDTAGSPIAAAQRLTNDTDNDNLPRLVWTGSEYGLTWNNGDVINYEIYYAPLSADGVMAPEVRISVGDWHSIRPDMVWNGTEFGIAWEDERHGLVAEIYFARVGCCDDMDSDGYTECEEDNNDHTDLVNPNAFEVCDGVANNSDYFADEICDGICDAPERAGAEIRVTNHPYGSVYPDIAWTGSDYGIVYSEWVVDAVEANELYFARFDSYGNQVGGNVRITNDTWDSDSPSVAWTGKEYGVAYVRDEGDKEIFFARLNSDGSMIGSDIRLTSNDIRDQTPRVVWTGAEYGVFWKTLIDGTYQLYFARLDAEGHPLGPNIQVTSSANVYDDYLTVVWTGMDFGVAWTDVEFLPSRESITFARLDANGNLLGTPATVSGPADYSIRPTMAWSGDEYAIAWSEGFSSEWNIGFIRLDYTGTAIAPATLLTNDSSSDLDPSLTWTGNEYAISWFDDVSGLNEIYFAPVSADGVMGSIIKISDGTGSAAYPVVLWNGFDHGITWTDNRHGPWEVYFARVACCDDVDSDGYTECQTETNDVAPAINPDYPEICDGYDNNSDQAMDEACDRDCDSPERWGAEIRITDDAAISGSVSPVWNGNGYGLAWHDERDGNKEIYFAALDSSGLKTGSDIRVSYNTGNSESPSMVWTGAAYGVAWRDTSSGNSEIFFGQRDASGAAIGSYRQITLNSGASYSPSLAWNGSEYGLAWMDDSSGDWEIYFTRFDTTGIKIGHDRRLTSRAGDSWAPQLVWDGNGYGLSWQEEGDGVLEIYFMKLDPHGNQIGSDLRLTNDPANSHAPRMAWSGSEFGITWYDMEPGNKEIYFARVHEEGYQIGSNTRITYHYSITAEPHITWSGSEWGLSWVDNRWGNFEIAFARLDPAGSKIGGNLRISEATEWSEWPRIVWNGTHYAMAWQDERDGNKEIYFASVRCCDDADSDGWTTCEGDSNDGSSLIHPGRTEVCDGVDNNGDGALDEVCDTGCDSPDMPGTEVRETNDAGTSGGAATVWTGAFYGVAWHDDRDGNQEIYFNRYYPDGAAVGSDLRITYAETNSASPSIVWNGEEYGIAFRDARDGNYELYFVRLDPWGSKIGEEVRITYDPAASYGPTLVWTGREYGLAWMDNRSGNWSLYMTRIDRSGNKIGSDMLVSDSASDAWSPHLAWSGNLYGLAWRDNRGTNWELYFTRIDELGNKLAADINLSNEYHDSYVPSALWNGSEFAISWYDKIPGNSEIYFTRVGEDGIQIGGNVRVTNNSAISAVPDLAWTGTEYGVTWYDGRDNNYEIYFARLDAAGAKIGSDVRISQSNSTSEYPVIAWDGAEYGLFWQDQRDGNSEIYFSAVKCCGNDVDSDGYGACDDCDDRIDYVNPGESEVCDGLDNNCDTVIDEGFFTPGVTSGLAIGSDKQTFIWDGEPVADRYDIVKGDLFALRSSGGNFNASLLDCLENDSGDASAPDGLDPGAGAGWYYLVRAVDDCKEGSYDSGQPSQVGSRDAEIDASGNSCP